MARGKNPCKVCHDRPANVRGGICHVCNETEAGKAFLAGVEVEQHPPLADDPTETDVQAMGALWLNEGKARTKRQKSWVPLYKESPKAFRDRLDKLRSGLNDNPPGPAGPTTSSPGTPWDGSGPCPTCKQDLDPITNDLGHERVEELLAEQFELVRLFRRHKAEFVAWLAARGPRGLIGGGS